jgi:cyclopropane-fatty-acyl-phospholipid synthase
MGWSLRRLRERGDARGHFHASSPPFTVLIYPFHPLQHVGTQHYETYFKLVDWALKDKDATAVVTSTTFPEARYRTYQPEDFMRRYMWPNSALPCTTALINAATKGSKNRFTVQFIENHGSHYPRTLREWGRRLESNVTMDTMAKRYPGLRDPAAFESFKRKWRYLFAYAGAGFAKGYISCHMLTFYKVRPTPDLTLNSAER